VWRGNKPEHFTLDAASPCGLGSRQGFSWIQIKTSLSDLKTFPISWFHNITSSSVLAYLFYSFGAGDGTQDLVYPSMWSIA
jgi:hypothetical protein